MKLALEIINREIAQRELANKHNQLQKDEITKELESLQKVVNFISSNGSHKNSTGITHEI